MTTITKTFAAVGDASGGWTLQPQRVNQPGANSATYAITGTFVATLVLESTQDGVNWTPSLSFTAPLAAAILYGPGPSSPSLTWRFRCSDYTSGSPAITLADSVNVISQVLNTAGAIVWQITDSARPLPLACNSLRWKRWSHWLPLGPSSRP